MGAGDSTKEEHSSRLYNALGSSHTTKKKKRGGGRDEKREREEREKGGRRRKEDVVKKPRMCFAYKSIIKRNEMKT